MSEQGGSERTEKASKKKKQKAREEGQVIKSRELGTAFSLIALTGFMYIVWDQFTVSASAMLANDLSENVILASSVNVDTRTVMHAYAGALLDIVRIIWPVLLIALLSAILINVLQTGFLFSTKALMPKFSRINPIEGFKKLFSTRALAEMIKALLKVSFLCYFAYSEYINLIPKFPTMMNQDLAHAFSQFMETAMRIGLKMGGILVGLAGIDYLYQWWRYEKDLMMTKQEVKEEYKQLEGDPQIKGMIKRKQRQMSRMRMMKRMQEADVVITNPTHYAVAIRYDENEDKAPLVLAKGADYVAGKIKERARELSIEIIENKPVAQALFKYCEVGDEIPKDMYQTVAEILVYVYKMRNKAKGAGR